MVAMNGSRTSVVLILVVLIVVAAAFGVACSGDEGSETETSPSATATATTTSSPSPRETVSPAEFEAAARDAANSALPTLEDMPPGWTASTPSEEDVDLPGLSEECSALDADISSVAEAHSDEFTGPSEQNVDAEVWVFATEEAATTAMDDYIDAMARCRDEAEAGSEKLFRDGYEESGGDPASLTDVSVSVAALSFTSLGDASSAYRLNVEYVLDGEFYTFDVDEVIMRSGRIVGDVTYGYLATYPDGEEELQIAQRFVDKMASADSSLPE